jgi:hypothetical protein
VTGGGLERKGGQLARKEGTIASFSPTPHHSSKTLTYFYLCGIKNKKIQKSRNLK